MKSKYNVLETFSKTMISYNKKGYNKETLLDLYKSMLKPRLIEEKMLILLRQGKISKWFSGIGQEAISVGVTKAMQKDEYILPMHRNLGVFTTREIPLYRLFSQWQGKANGFTKGRDRSFHFGTQDYNVVGMISHLGPQLSLAAGVGGNSHGSFGWDGARSGHPEDSISSPLFPRQAEAGQGSGERAG